MGKCKNFWNKKNLLGFLYKNYSNYNFDLIVDKSGEYYILLWEKNYEDIVDSGEILKVSFEIFSNINNALKNELNISNKKSIPFISVTNAKQFLGTSYKKIIFPNQDTFNNIELVIKEVLDMIIRIGENQTILKGSMATYLCYNIGNQIPYNMNFSSKNELIYESISAIIKYCDINRLIYKKEFNHQVDKIGNSLDTIRGYIKIDNSFTITFDNWVELYPENEILLINNIPTYNLDFIKKSKKFIK